MRGLNPVEIHVMRASLPNPGNALVYLDTPEQHAAVDRLEARGLLARDTEDVYWPTAMGRVVFVASLSGSVGRDGR